MPVFDPREPGKHVTNRKEIEFRRLQIKREFTTYQEFANDEQTHVLDRPARRRNRFADLLARAWPQITTPAKARNVVLVHGLFADGSCWSEVIARLQAAGLNATAVQNPLTTLPEAVASAERVLARQDGPTVLVGHSFSGMIVTEAGMHPNVSALVYVAARAPRCRRRLYRARESLSDATGIGRHRL